MHGDALLLMKHLDGCGGLAHVELFTGQLIWGTVEMARDLEMGIGSDAS